MLTIVEGVKKLSREQYQGWLLAPGTIYWGVQQGDKWVIFNCAPIVRNGNMLSFHCKKYQDDHLSGIELWGQSDQGDVSRDEQSFCRQLNNPIFEVGNLLVGMDICLDHTCKPVGLSESMASYKGLDILLLVAAAMHFHFDKASIVDNGLVLRCDGASADPIWGTQVFRKGSLLPCAYRENIFHDKPEDDAMRHGYRNCAYARTIGSTAVDYDRATVDYLVFYGPLPLPHAMKSPPESLQSRPDQQLQHGDQWGAWPPASGTANLLNLHKWSSLKKQAIATTPKLKYALPSLH